MQVGKGATLDFHREKKMDLESKKQERKYGNGSGLMKTKNKHRDIKEEKLESVREGKEEENSEKDRRKTEKIQNSLSSLYGKQQQQQQEQKQKHNYMKY